MRAYVLIQVAVLLALAAPAEADQLTLTNQALINPGGQVQGPIRRGFAGMNGDHWLVAVTLTNGHPGIVDVPPTLTGSTVVDLGPAGGAVLGIHEIGSTLVLFVQAGNQVNVKRFDLAGTPLGTQTFPADAGMAPGLTTSDVSLFPDGQYRAILEGLNNTGGGDPLLVALKLAGDGTASADGGSGYHVVPDGLSLGSFMRATKACINPVTGRVVVLGDVTRPGPANQIGGFSIGTDWTGASALKTFDQGPQHDGATDAQGGLCLGNGNVLELGTGNDAPMNARGYAQLLNSGFDITHTLTTPAGNSALSAGIEAAGGVLFAGALNQGATAGYIIYLTDPLTGEQTGDPIFVNPPMGAGGVPYVADMAPGSPGGGAPGAASGAVFAGADTGGLVVGTVGAGAATAAGGGGNQGTTAAPITTVPPRLADLATQVKTMGFLHNGPAAAQILKTIGGDASLRELFLEGKLGTASIGAPEPQDFFSRDEPILAAATFSNAGPTSPAPALLFWAGLFEQTPLVTDQPVTRIGLVGGPLTAGKHSVTTTVVEGGGIQELNRANNDASTQIKVYDPNEVVDSSVAASGFLGSALIASGTQHLRARAAQAPAVTDEGPVDPALARLDHVEIAVLRAGKRGKPCRWLGRTVKPTKLPPSNRPVCLPDERVWHRAKGTTKWSYHLRHRLRPGRYTLYVRTVNRAGASNATFSRAAHTLVRFRVR